MKINKIISIALAAIYLSFSGLQFNDPDPAVWVSIYALVAALCLWNGFSRVHWAVALAAVAANLIGAFLLWPGEYHGVTGKMSEHHEIELARESLGLIINALGLIYILVRSLSNKAP